MKVYLVGYMASGKTRIGLELSELTGYQFLDTDHLFEERYRISILDFFERYSEDSFRKIEKDLLQETLKYQDAIIATGGGTPCFFNNMDIIRNNGFSIYLRMEVLSLVDRLAVVRKKRPLLKELSGPELEPYIKTQLAERELFYNRANIIVDAGKVDAAEILNYIPGIKRD
jgi:shikimate kinase